MYQFFKAKAIWGSQLSQEYNQFLGFHRSLFLSSPLTLTISIAARNYYRLYINGDMIANGPARTAKHFCRVDEITLTLSGKVDIALEVAAYDSPEHYCNDCTLESGMLTAEVRTPDQTVLAYTGDELWHYFELSYRDSYAETMSHSREIIEVYHLDETSYQWRFGVGKYQKPVILNEPITYLERRSPYPTYQPFLFPMLLDVCDIVPSDGKETDSNLEIAKIFKSEWYASLPKENCFLNSLINEVEAPFTGTYHYEASMAGFYPVTSAVSQSDRAIKICPGEHPAAFIWALNRSEVGFLDLQLTVEKNTIVDFINTDYLENNGSVKPNTYITRYTLQPGSYHLTTFEPKLVKYLKLIFRTKGTVNFSVPKLLNYTYPASEDCFFLCSDHDLNSIYRASKHTLKLNTLDIFMDCPQRERAGWLCDSYFTSTGAWQLFGDLSVEKDFIENFMLTDSDEIWNAFFPEVYPASKTNPSDPGIRSWSFWLIAELADYCERSGDIAFIEFCRKRVTHFIDGMLSLRGESGLLENMDCLFVDWSLSNKNFCLEPISIPCNCLAVYILEKMAHIYQNSDWEQAAAAMRKIIEDLDSSVSIFGGGGDSAKLLDGTLQRGDCPTESGIALELWSGFHRKDKKYIRDFAERMGVSPLLPADPNIGKANLFIGLMIRFDVLAKLDEIEALIRDLRALYLPELSIETETLFEGVTEKSGCHGFNGAIGAIITNKILGLGQPKQLTKMVCIEPHPCRLKWAKGAAHCTDGPIRFQWSADYEEHIFDMTLSLPEEWNYELKLPFELNGWTILLNKEKLSF